MTDLFDIEEMLEAPFKNNTNSFSNLSNSSITGHSVGDNNANNNLDKDGSKKSSKDHSSRGRDGHRSRDGRHRSRSREDKRPRDEDLDRSSHRHSSSKHSSSRDRERNSASRRSRSRERDRHSSRSSRHRHSSRSPRRDKRSRSREPQTRRAPSPILTPEERDSRTIFVWQLAARIRPRDLEEFFSAVGEVRDVRIIMDNKTKRSKGIAYVEFRDIASVPLALALSGTRVLGVPIQIQQSQAEKNRVGQPSSTLSNLASGVGLVDHHAVAAAQQGKGVGGGSSSLLPIGASMPGGSVKVYVGCLHPNISEDMLRTIFEPFGPVSDIQLTRDLLTNKSTGSGYVIFQNGEDAYGAIEHLNGFELANKRLKVSTIADAVKDDDVPKLNTASLTGGAPSLLGDPTALLFRDSSLSNCLSMDLPTLAAQLACGDSSIIQALDTTSFGNPLMSSLSGVGSETDTASSNRASSNNASASSSATAVNTTCFMLSNMFDSSECGNDDAEKSKLAEEIRADVIEECSVHGGVVHVFVDVDSPEGNVYVKAFTANVARDCVKALHGRYFSSRLVTAAYIPQDSYHELFPDSVNAFDLLETQ